MVPVPVDKALRPGLFRPIPLLKMYSAEAVFSRDRPWLGQWATSLSSPKSLPWPESLGTRDRCETELTKRALVRSYWST